MSVIDRVLSGLRRVPRGFSADGRPLCVGLAAALDAQRARGAEPLDPTKADHLGVARGDGRQADATEDRAAGATR